MNKPEILKYIDNNFFTKSKNRLSIKTKDIPDYILTEINNHSHTFKDITLNQKIYNYINDIIDSPKCICGKDIVYYNINKGYKKTCGDLECAGKISSDKMKDTKNKNSIKNKNDSTEISSMNKNELKIWINDNLFKKNKKINGNLVNENHTFYNKHKDIFNLIYDNTKLLINARWSDRIYFILNDETYEDYKYKLIKIQNIDDAKIWIEYNIYNKSSNIDGNKTKINSKYYFDNIENFNMIMNLTDFLPKNSKLNERIYCIMNDIQNTIKCNNDKCSNDVTFNGASYNKYCSFKCSRTAETYKILKETCMEKFGVDNVFKSNEFIMNNVNNHKRIERQRLTQKTNYYNSCITDVYNKDYHLSVVSDFKQYYEENIIILKCDKCNNEYTKDNLIINGTIHHCNNCYPKTSVSTQYSIFEYFLQNDNSLIYEDKMILRESGSRYSKEVDIYSPNHKFGIEYDGLMWHSFGKSKHSMFNNYESESFDKFRHIQKTKLCEDKSIQLFHIFENEWLDINKQNIWKSVINSKLSQTKRVFARKTTIKEVSSKDSNSFLNSNHLQGSVNSSIRIGLYVEDELLSIMTFGKSRYDKKYDYELLRFCTKLNHTVVGGGSKLLKYFETNYNPKSLLSYANRRWSQGNLYSKLGFDYISETSPNYFYFKSGSNQIEGRIKYQKHKLKNILESYDNNLTESENMYNNDYRKIYDCGNLVFVKEY